MGNSLKTAAKEERWGEVESLLRQSCFSSKVIDQFIDACNNYDKVYITHEILSHCSAHQMGRLLTIQNRMRPRNSADMFSVWIIEHACETADCYEFAEILPLVDDDFLSNCSTDQLERLLTAAAQRKYWQIVNRMFVAVGDTEKRVFIIEKVCKTITNKNIPDCILTRIDDGFLSHCSTEQLDSFMTIAGTKQLWSLVNKVMKTIEYCHNRWVFYIQQACETADYLNFTDHILPLVDDDFLFLCNTDQLSCMLTAATRRKLWNMVNRVFTAGVSHETRLWVIEQACETADYQNFTDHILPLVDDDFLSQFSTEQLDRLLTAATKRARWHMVNKVCKVGGSHETRVLVIEQACETAEYQNFSDHILPLVGRNFVSSCSPEQLELLLTAATRCKLWNMVKRVFTADVSHETRVWVIKQACETTGYYNFTEHMLQIFDDGFLTHCSTVQLSWLITAATIFEMWNTVNTVFKDGGSHKTRVWVIQQACETADYQNFTDHILPLVDDDFVSHCSTEQMDSLLAAARNREFWHMINSLVSKAEYSHDNWVFYIQLACETADYQNFTDHILPLVDDDFLFHCNTDQLGCMLTTTVKRKLWNMVNRVFTAVVSHKTRVWVIEQACKTADYLNCTDHILPLVDDTFLSHCSTEQLDSFMTIAGTKQLWSLVNKVMKTIEYCHNRWVFYIQQACETADYLNFTDHILPLVDDNFLFLCNTDQLCCMLTAATRRKLWIMVNRVFTAGVSHETRLWVIEQACETADYYDFTDHILPLVDNDFLSHCSPEQLDRFLTAATRRKLWNMVNTMLTADVSHETRVRVIEQACETADYQNFTDHILPLVDDNFLSQCSTQQLDRFMTDATKQALWNMVNKLFKVCGSHETRVWVIQQACKTAGYQNFTDHILPLVDDNFLSQCSTEKLDRFMTDATKREMTDATKRALWNMVNTVFKVGGSHETRVWVIKQACKTAGYQNFTDHILPLIDDDFLSHCSTENLESLLTTARKQGLWNMVNRMLKAGISQEKRVLFIEEACKSTFDWIITDNILPLLDDEFLSHCITDELDRLLTAATKRALWNMVNIVFKVGGSHKTRVWVIEQACETANYQNFTDHILPLVDDDFVSHCSTEQMDSLLAAARNREFWHMINSLVSKAEYSHDNWVFYIQLACETADYQNFTDHILPLVDDDFLFHCNTDQLGCMLTTTVKRKLWNMVNRVFTADVSHKTRVWVIEQACKTADYLNCTDHILPLVDDNFLSQCSTEQLDRFMTDATKREMTDATKRALWNMVNTVFKVGGSHKTRVWVIQQACKTAGYENFTDHILPLVDDDFLSHCSPEQLDRFLTAATRRKLWNMVNRMFTADVSHETRVWVMEQACETAGKQNFIIHILPLVDDDLLSDCSTEQLDCLVTTVTLWNMSKMAELMLAHLVKRGLWLSLGKLLTIGVSDGKRIWAIEEATKTAGDKDMMYYILPQCRDDQLESVLRQLVTRGLWRSVDNLLERGVKTKSLTWALSEACKDCEYSSAMDRIEQRLGKASVQLLVRSLTSNQLSQEAKNVAIRFALKQYRWRIIKGTSLLQVWEQVRRDIFRKAVEQKQWTIVNKWADHNLYDDERWWALEEAYTHKQWDVMLRLADHGLTEIELMRVRYRLAKHADWDVVLRMVRRGVDVTEVREVVESAMISRKTAADKAKQRVLLQRWGQFCQLEEKLTQASARRFKLPSTAQQWRTILFRLHRHPGTLSMSLRQNQRSKTIDMLLLQRAIEQRNWHVVIHLVRLGVHPDQRDSLLTDMIRRRQWGVCRALLEQGISVKTCLRALSVFMEMNQWMLVARVLEFITDDALKGQIEQDKSVGSLVWQCVCTLLNCGMCVGDAVKFRVMKRAMERREGSVVGECISTMQHYRLSVKERAELIQQAISRGFLQAVKPLVEEKDELGIQHRDTALLAAIEQRQWDVVDCCQFQGADIDMKDESGETPLCREFRKEAIEVVDWKTVENLVIRGAYPNVLDKDGCSVLNRAIGEKQWGIARLLIEYHGDIHKPAKTKLDRFSFDTPLQFLIDMRQGEIIHHTLLWCPDQAKGVSYKGETTLHAMTLDWRPELLYYQVVRGVSPLTLTKGGHSALLYAVQNDYCPQKMVAECIRLGFSTHQPRFTQLTTVDIAASVTYGLWRNVDNFHEYFYHGIHRIHSPFLLAVLRGMHVVAHMLHESGSCSYAELRRLYTVLQDLSDPNTELGRRLLKKANPPEFLKQDDVSRDWEKRNSIRSEAHPYDLPKELAGDQNVYDYIGLSDPSSFPREDDLDRHKNMYDYIELEANPSSLLKQSDFKKVYDFIGKQTKLSKLRKQGDSDEYKQIYDLFIANIVKFLPYLREIASTPRRLESSCRLAISHCLTVCRRRERAVRELDVTDTTKNYLLFSDLTDPKYNPCHQHRLRIQLSLPGITTASQTTHRVSRSQAAPPTTSTSQTTQCVSSCQAARPPALTKERQKEK